MQEVDGSELVARTLAAAGVEVVFMIHGGHIDPIYQACLEHGVRMVSVRHECAGGHAAEGYARAGRRLGVALVTAGPGVTNIVTSMANANLDRTPVLYIGGSAATDQDETNALQSGVDQVALATPVTKWAHRIQSVKEIPRLLAQAIRIATTAPAGPVFVEIPTDVMADVAGESLALAATDPTLFHAGITPAAADIDEAIRLLSSAARPAIMIGGEVYASGAWEELRSFVASTSLPVFAQYDALGIVPSDHPLWAGTLWQLPLLSRAVQPDLVLALGVRFGWHAPGFETLTNAEIIHIEVDPKEIGRPRPPRLAILAGCREALRMLNERAGQGSEFPDGTTRARELREAIAVGIAGAAVMPPGRADGIHPYDAARIVCETLGPDAVIVGDGAFGKHWLDDAISCTKPGSYFTHGPLGTMGMGLGTAMGARLASPGRTVACVTGDGSVGFNIAEFGSMVRHDIPVVVVILNNRSWGQPVFPSRSEAPYPTVGIDLGGPAYAEVAAGFGAFSRKVDRLGDLAPALRDACASGVASCIEVRVMADFQPSFSMRALGAR